jgi:hypothetical protein
VLVLFTEHQDSVLAVVTSAVPRTPRDVALIDWQAAGLRSPSTARLDKLVTMSHQRLWAKLGSLTAQDWQRVADSWNREMKL